MSLKRQTTVHFLSGSPPPIWRKNAHMTRLSDKLFLKEKWGQSEQDKPPNDQKEIKTPKTPLEIRSKWALKRGTHGNRKVTENHHFYTTVHFLLRGVCPCLQKVHVLGRSQCIFFLKKTAQTEPGEAPYAQKMVKNSQKSLFCYIYKWSWPYAPCLC